MIVTPGPASIVIPIGLQILAMEFLWAERLLRWFKSKIPERFRGKKPAPTGGGAA